MGIGKLAISVLLIGILAFALVTAFSMAKSDQAPAINTSVTTNSTILVANTVGGAGATLFVPLVIISGIMLLLGAFVVLKRSSVR
jgi:hypothetical protein